MLQRSKQTTLFGVYRCLQVGFRFPSISHDAGYERKRGVAFRIRYFGLANHRSRSDSPLSTRTTAADHTNLWWRANEIFYLLLRYGYMNTVPPTRVPSAAILHCTQTIRKTVLNQVRLCSSCTRICNGLAAIP